MIVSLFSHQRVCVNGDGVPLIKHFCNRLSSLFSTSIGTYQHGGFGSVEKRTGPSIHSQDPLESFSLKGIQGVLASPAREVFYEVQSSL